MESRYVVLGHVQRGGTPIAADRVLATRFGAYAMGLLQAGKRDRLVVMQHGGLTDIPLVEAARVNIRVGRAAGKQRLVPTDHPMIAAARSVYTSFGDDVSR